MATRRDGNSIDEMTNGAIRSAPFGQAFAVEKRFFYSFNDKKSALAGRRKMLDHGEMPFPDYLKAMIG
jgi:hypothetical protein